MAVLKGTKKLLLVRDVQPYEFPTYKEFQLKHLYALCSKSQDLMDYLPDWNMAARPPDRTFCFTILASKMPDFTNALINHCNELRISRHGVKVQPSNLQVKSDVAQFMHDILFRSCK